LQSFLCCNIAGERHCVVTENIPSHAVYLKNNTNLTRLKLDSGPLEYISEDQIPALIEIVNCNTTLKVLVLKTFATDDENWIDPLRLLISALHENTALQRIQMHANCKEDVSHYMTTHHKELTLDNRITWRQ
jgi:hypothetical protein